MRISDWSSDVCSSDLPGGGDDTRQWGPPFVTGEGGEALGAAYYHSCNRGKRSVAIDIATGEGQAELRDLLTGADVVIENYKVRSEEHTSELQSLMRISYAVFCL